MAMLLVFASPGVLSAHTPTAGAASQYDESHSDLKWRFVNGGHAWPSSWATPAVNEAVNNDAGQQSDRASPTANRSAMPDYDETTSGQGSLVWTNSAASPCGTEAPDWIACNPPHATNALTWTIHVRNMSYNGYSNFHWWEHPSATGTLFLMERAVIHEAMHNVLDIPNHDSQLSTLTIMRSASPSYNNPGWNTQSILDCDEAAAFLEYDVRDSLVGYPDCFDHVTNHGVDGLKSKVTFTASDTVQCLGSSVTFAGVLSVGVDATNYKLLSGNPLGSRSVNLQRSSPGSGTWSTYRTVTTNATTGAYSTSVGFSTATSWDWRVTYAGEVGLDPRTSATIRVSWSSGC